MLHPQSMDTIAREKKIRNVTLWGALVNLVLTGLKLLAGVLGHSAAMLADGLHSLSDLLSDAVVLIFTHISSKGEDRDHSFGHGKFETFATLIVSVMLIVVGAGLMKSGVCSIINVLHGEVLPSPGYIALAAAAISIISKEILFRVTSKVGRNVESPIVIANAWHHRSDAMSSVATLIGVACAHFFGPAFRIFDPIASTLIVIFILVPAVRMIRPAFFELMEKSIPVKRLAEVRRAVENVDGVREVKYLRVRRNGHYVIPDVGIAVDRSLTVEQAAPIAAKVEERLAETLGEPILPSIAVLP